MYTYITENFKNELFIKINYRKILFITISRKDNEEHQIGVDLLRSSTIPYASVYLSCVNVSIGAFKSYIN